MLTKNFVASGFSLHGLYVDFMGPGKSRMVYEFPVYNFAAGALSLIFGHLMLIGKLLSLGAFVFSLLLLIWIVDRFYGTPASLLAGLFFVLSPLAILMRTSFQPDALGLMFVVLAVYELIQWRETRSVVHLSLFAAALILAGLLKILLLVPFVPILALLFFASWNGKQRPSWYWAPIVALAVLLPVAAWYVYAVRATDPLLMAKGMFFIGDLHRFLSSAYYLKPAIIVLFYVLAAAGIVFATAALLKGGVVEYALASGIPLYLILVPTSAEQHYYQFAVAPIVAVLMALGALRLRRSFAIPLFVAFLTISAVASVYLLRHDQIFEEAGAAVASQSRPDDLVVSLALHDRVYISSPENKVMAYPAMHYFAARQGWNVCYRRGESIVDVERDIDSYRRSGAVLLVLTWYSTDLEPVLTRHAPETIKRNPHVDGEELFHELRERYQFAYVGRNYGILRLESSGSVVSARATN